MTEPRPRRPPHSLLGRLEPHERVRGRYRIAWMQRQSTVTGSPFWSVGLADRSATLAAFGWPDRFAARWGRRENAVVEVEFRTRIHRGRLVADLTALDPVTPPPAAYLDLLPAQRCPRAGLLERLVRLAEHVRIGPLAHFLDLALGREELFDFLAAPASVGYHHGYPGGLLEHSLEVAEALAAMAHPSGPERELAIVGGLFHDLGKIRSFDEKLRITLLGRLIGHEALTLELLAQPLAELDWLWEEGAAALRAVWSGQKTALARRLSIATAVQGADWVSAARGNEARAFGRGQGGWARHNHQGYWRPRLPEGLEPA